ncbi:CD1845 family protein [Pseudoflavonifractor sp. P01025]|uniref:CD1845 family protein n=1 Tax=Flintibacter porci TaxID=3342383 RepID=UPI0035B64EE0
MKVLLKILVAPLVVLLTLAIWICVGLVYVSGLVLGLVSMVIAFLGVAVLVTYSPQNGFILLVIAFLISPFGLPKLAFWLLGKVQDLKFAVQNVIYR